jgi:hypothetical protein
MGRDARLTLARPDLAAESLRGDVAAKRYVAPVEMRVSAPTLPLRASPDAAEGFTTELFLGGAFHVCETRDGWAWGQAARDGYVGYAPAERLAPAGAAPTHRVAALSTNLYVKASIKSAAGWVPMGARLTGVVEGEFLATEHGYLPLIHLTVADAPDPVAVAEKFLGAPYLWGGGTALGIDCSGLMQIAWMMAGRPCPRDSDQQEAALGPRLPEGVPLARGDLVFWKGHVGVMADAATLLHATAKFMAVVREPFAEALERIGPPTSILRPI